MIFGPTLSPVKRGRKRGANPSAKALATRALRERRVAAGLCAECGKEKRDGRFLGQRCRAGRRPASRERKRLLRESGICCQCERAQATGSGYCDPCYAKWKPLKYAWLGMPAPVEQGRVRR